MHTTPACRGFFLDNLFGGILSSAANLRLKSADLIGIHRPSGRFMSIEVKRPGWKHSDASERDRAQAAWAATLAAMGGVALRVTSAESIKNLEI